MIFENKDRSHRSKSVPDVPDVPDGIRERMVKDSSITEPLTINH